MVEKNNKHDEDVEMTKEWNDKCGSEDSQVWKELTGNAEKENENNNTGVGSSDSNTVHADENSNDKITQLNMVMITIMI